MTVLDGDRTLGGRYRLGDRLGRGAMADVYDAVDTRLERAVAVKVLRSAAVPGPDGQERFAREARAAARLSHPHSVAVYDSGTDRGVAYIVMERLPGVTMADYMAAGPLPLGWVLRVALDALDALGAAHAAGLTHRDVKPANILITPGDRAKVADFGVAKAADLGGDLTATGLVVGTAAYLPPERIEGAPATPRGDLYALGVVLYEALAGRKPFTGDSPVALVEAARHVAAPDLARLRPDLPPAVVAAVARAMARDPAQRFATADAMARALREVPSPAAVPSPDPVAPPTPPPLAVGPAGPTAVLPPATDPVARPTPPPVGVGPGGPTALLPPAPPRRARRRAALLAGLLVLAVAGAVAGLLLTRRSPGPQRADVATGSATTASAPPASVPSTTAPAPPTTVPATTTPTAAAPTTPATVAATAPSGPAAPQAPTDPQAAALQAAAGALEASGGGGPQAAAILDQVAALPRGARPAAAAAAVQALRTLMADGRLTPAQYRQAVAPLAPLDPGATGSGGPGHHGRGGHGGG